MASSSTSRNMAPSDRKGMSNVLATLLLILLTVVVIGVVWGAVQSFVNDSIDEQCLSLNEKVTINNEFTCYNATSDDVEFALSVGDVVLDGILVSFGAEGERRTARIPSSAAPVPLLRERNGDFDDPLVIPGKEEGKAYVYNADGALLGRVTTIEIAPIMDSTTCEVGDSMTSIPTCL